MIEVVAALIWDENRFLACQRPAHKARGLLWEFVGGKVEPGETREQALIRECQEELAITVAVQDVFMEVDHVYPDLTVHLTLFNASIAFHAISVSFAPGGDGGAAREIFGELSGLPAQRKKRPLMGGLFCALIITRLRNLVSSGMISHILTR